MNNFILREIEKNEIDKNKGNIQLDSEKQIFANQLLNNGINLEPIILKKKNIFIRLFNKIFRNGNNIK